jgi:hypothetical protein
MLVEGDSASSDEWCHRWYLFSAGVDTQGYTLAVVELASFLSGMEAVALARLEMDTSSFLETVAALAFPALDREAMMPLD